MSLIKYKYKFWEALVKVAPSEEEQKRMFFKLSEDCGLTERQLKNLFNLKPEDEKDIPGTLLVKLAIRLGVDPLKVVNMPLPNRTMLDEITDKSNLVKRLKMTSKPARA